MMNEIAVIGIDGVFADHINIDRVERAFYQGSASSSGKQYSESHCAESVMRLAVANQLELSDIDVVVVSTNTFNDKLNNSFASFSIVTNLSLAMNKSSELLLSNQRPVAIVGFNRLLDNRTDTESVARATFAFDQDFEHYQSAEGLVSVLIATSNYAKEQSLYIYSWLKSYDTNTNVSEAISRSLQKANLSSEQVKLVEVSALANDKEQGKELDGLFDAYSSAKQLNTAISCARSVTGEGNGFSQLAGLLKTIIALQQNYIPGTNNWNSPSDQRWQSSTFYFPTEARTWYPEANGHADNRAHTAAYSCLTEDSYCHLLLQENQAENIEIDVRHNGYMACSELSLFLLAFNTQDELLSKLDELKANCQKVVDNNLSSFTISDIAKSYYQQSTTEEGLTYCATLIAETTEELFKEINLAKKGIVKALTDRAEWKTPKGSFFTASPVGDDNGDNSNVAFFYPGIGATYVGLGRDLFHLFPQIYQPVAALADDIGETLKDTLLNPRSLSALSFKEIKQLDSDLRNSLAHIAECGVAFACVFTKIFEEVFDVFADYSAGYSMGEVSMFAALGCWQQPGLMSARLAQSETFNQRLSGELSTLRTLWDIELIDSNDYEDEKIWETYSIRATLNEVTAASEGEDRVFCTIINTPDNLLIGGYPEACERVIKKLGVRSMAMDMPNAIHSAPAQAEYQDMETLFTMDVTERIKTKMYSSSCYLPIPQRSKAIANSIAKCLCDPVDFPRLVNSLYNKGARVFVEMGPGRSLCSWTDKILKLGENKTHASVPVNAKGTSDELTYIRALAKLISHGVAVDLETVFNGSIVVRKGL